MRSRSLLFPAVGAVALAGLLSVNVYADHARYYVLDGFGGVHAGGGAPIVAPATPYFGCDIARAITYRNVPPRISGSIDGSGVVVSSTSYVSIASTTTTAADDGFLLVIGTTAMFCSNASAGNSSGDVNFDVDALTGIAGIEYPAVIVDCTAQIPSSFILLERIVTVSGVLPVTAGTHTVHLLGQKDAPATFAPMLRHLMPVRSR